MTSSVYNLPQKKSITVALQLNNILIYLILSFSIYFNFKSETKIVVNTKFGSIYLILKVCTGIGIITNANLTFADMVSKERSYLLNKPLSSHILFEDQDICYRYLRNLSDSTTQQICELRMHKNDGTAFYVQLESTTALNKNRDKKQYRIMAIDISGRKQVEEALAIEKKSLQEALLRVKELTGLLPICASCKKIRDDNGYWNQIESYIEGHSETKFSHGMCPECSDELYGDEAWYIKMKKEKE